MSRRRGGGRPGPQRLEAVDMQCPFCRVDEDRVLDSRSIGEGSAIRRRRKCLACGRRFTTYERTEVAPRLVIKKDSSRELFSRDKILGGLIKACHKRNISVHELENLAAKIEAEIYEECDNEVSTKVIGEKVSEALKKVDHVAFVRFASVYREFKDVKEFLGELIPLIRGRDNALPAELKSSGGESLLGAGDNEDARGNAKEREDSARESKVKPGEGMEAVGKGRR